MTVRSRGALERRRQELGAASLPCSRQGAREKGQRVGWPPALPAPGMAIGHGRGVKAQAPVWRSHSPVAVGGDRSQVTAEKLVVTHPHRLT